VLGQGGFAITYLALDTQLKRTVAINSLTRNYR
jgi:serine/threonine protein kinase